jgi:hypothetical protein
VGCGPHLSPHDAQVAIEEHFKYPKTSGGAINVDDDKGEVLASLIKNGDLNPAPVDRNSFYGDDYGPTPKGKSYILSTVSVRDSGRVLKFYCGIWRLTIKEVNEVLIDKQNSLATVTYTVVATPNEPAFSSVYRKTREGKIAYYDSQGARPARLRVTLKKYDKGWRVESEEQDVSER